MVFEELQSDLEVEGSHQIQPFVLPSEGVDAPQRRERVWFIVYRDGAGLQKAQAEKEATRSEQSGELGEAAAFSTCLGHDNRGDNRQERHFQGNERTTQKDQQEWKGRKCRTGKTDKAAADRELTLLKTCGLSQRSVKRE